MTASASSPTTEDIKREFAERVNRVSFELSNLCPYAPRHPKCPAHYVKTPQILSSEVVFSVIEALATTGFDNHKKTIAWHCYCEPMADPRLFWFIESARHWFNETQFLLWTNGWYLDDRIAAELIGIGIDQFTLSAYTEADWDRFTAITDKFKDDAKWKIRRIQKLDDRLAWPPPEEDANYQPCFAPLRDLTIRSSGNIGLCCLDCNESVAFGNLHGRDFFEVIGENWARMIELQNELKQKIRRHDVCLQCPKKR